MPAPEGYDPVPLALLDSTVGNTDMVASVGLIFNKQLDLAKLEDGWFKLARSWPIIAARVRKSKQAVSGLEYQVPGPAKLAELEAASRQATEPLRKLFVSLDLSNRSISTYSSFSHKIVQDQLTDICLGTAPNPRLSRELTCINATRTFGQLLHEDQSFTTAQATLFSDATIVTISTNHIIGDGFGLSQVWAAWAKVLKGMVPDALQDLGKDPFIDYYGPEGALSKQPDGSPLPDPRGWYKYGLTDKIQFAGRALWDLHVVRPESTVGQYYVYLPEERVQQLVRKAQNDVDAHLEAISPLASSTPDKYSGGGGASCSRPKVKLSRLNVLFAWLIQNTQVARKNQNRRSTVLAICNTKGRPPVGYRPEMHPAHPFWGGAVAFPVHPRTSAEFVAMPLGLLALHIRESISDMSTPENVQAALVMSLNNMLWKNRKNTSSLYLFAKPGDYWSGMTDWRPIKFGETDFGGALPSEGQADTSQEVLKPVTLNVDLTTTGSKRDRWSLMGEAGKGCWFTGFMTREEATHPKGFGRFPLYE
ncbi:uncharacterized protein SPSC_03737 [Sporisorium scitamineum]|uniref:Acetyltransferase involved in MEL production n=1 Tax=Sporisorium scitamineum TaxID=49012 RepID=A0A0F7RTG6_9BASI|nr:uncharacterized protein SPSC_03737 [Sporisorium scitamineum]CDS00081.1 hypothetical protein [Sporisorium scitamineum]